jgi:hypothetical protein
MAPKSAHEAAKAKAAKEKKILIVLAVPLAIALFFAYHTVTKLNHSSAPEAVAPAATPTSAASASSTTPTATVSNGTPVSATLPTAPAPPPDAGKLSRMTLLSTKDPFFDAGPKVTASGGSGGQTQTQNQSTQPKQKAVPPADAVISVNGRIALVSVGQAFPVTKNPATNGVFRLVGLTAKTAKVAVVGGSYTTGAHVLTLTVNSVVTLLNTADGKRYTLVLYPVGTPAPGATQATATTTTTTTTGP